eukprot:TRINITY_DN14574_c0_g1_i2.p3 TRINITY_DN14574_c0_g1~~TRINITY_DN14574_c0_g1_i2.p3  ORF type:complete len:219 (+),score=-5.55 TRINITY_DN14574_c0_g1_i2:287-943(+)
MCVLLFVWCIFFYRCYTSEKLKQALINTFVFKIILDGYTRLNQFSFWEITQSISCLQWKQKSIVMFLSEIMVCALCGLFFFQHQWIIGASVICKHNKIKIIANQSIFIIQMPQIFTSAIFFVIVFMSHHSLMFWLACRHKILLYGLEQLYYMEMKWVLILDDYYVKGQKVFQIQLEQYRFVYFIFVIVFRNSYQLLARDNMFGKILQQQGWAEWILIY